jgi:CheY-like chemotaxis protein
MSQRIVVVDDSRTVCKAVEWVFHGSGFEVVAALTAEQGLDLARQVRPAAILVDYQLPDRSGYDLCAALRADGSLRGVPVIMLGGRFAPFEDAKARQSGADDVLMKPFKTDELLERVKAAVARGPVRQPEVAPPAPAAGFEEAPAAEPARPEVAAPPVGAPPPLPGVGGFRRPATPPPMSAVSAPQPPAAPAPVSIPTPPAFARPQVAAPPPPPAAPPPAYSAPAAVHAVPTVPVAAQTAPVAAQASLSPEQIRSMVEPLVVETVKAALPAIIKEVMPGMMKEILGAVLRQQLGPRIEDYSKKRIDTYVEQELPAVAQAAIDKQLAHLMQVGDAG